MKLDPHPAIPGKYVIRDGAVPTWPHLNIEDARLFLSRSGKSGFLAEYQHDFLRDASEYVLPHWDDDRNVITRSQFKAVFGAERAPWHRPKRWFNDWAKTRSARHANVAGQPGVRSRLLRGGRDGEHDDLVLATALALWQGTFGESGEWRVQGLTF